MNNRRIEKVRAANSEINKILCVNAVSYVYGAERSMLVILERLQSYGMEVRVACPRDSDLLVEEASRVGVECLPAPFVRFKNSFAPREVLCSISALKRGVKELRKHIRSEKPDVIYSNGIHSALYGSLAARLAGLPHAWQVRDWNTPRAVGYLLQRLSRAIIVPTRIVASRPAFNRVSEKKVSIIPNVVNLDEYRPRKNYQLQDEFDLPRSAIIVGMVAQLVPWKNHALFIRAAAEVVREFPEVYFFIIGDDPWKTQPGYKESLVNLAKSVEVTTRLYFTGYRRDIAEVMNSLSVLVLPSSREPFGRVIIEAMSVELPVIASDLGGGAEIITEGEEGLLFSAGNHKDLGSCILRLLNSPKLRAGMGKRGREKVKREFNAEAVARRYYDIFSKLCSK